MTVTAQPTLEDMRLRRALAARELAKRAGVALQTVTRIERHQRTPHMATIRKLAAALDCAPQDIAWPGDPFRKQTSTALSARD